MLPWKRSFSRSQTLVSNRLPCCQWKSGPGGTAYFPKMILFIEWYNEAPFAFSTPAKFALVGVQCCLSIKVALFVRDSLRETLWVFDEKIAIHNRRALHSVETVESALSTYWRSLREKRQNNPAFVCLANVWLIVQVSNLPKRPPCWWLIPSRPMRRSSGGNRGINSTVPCHIRDAAYFRFFVYTGNASLFYNIFNAFQKNHNKCRSTKRFYHRAHQVKDFKWN